MALNGWQNAFINHYYPNYTSLSDPDKVLAVLQQTINKSITSISDDDILAYALHFAYKDAFLQAGRFVGFTNVQHDAVNDFFAKLVKSKSYKASRNLIDAFASYIQATYSLTKTFQGKKHPGKTYTKKCTAYGLAQKYVNMFFKNMSLFDGFLKKIQCDYSGCDCPIDHNILVSLKHPYLSWGNMSKTCYLDCQNEIAMILSGKAIAHTDTFLSTLGNLAYDYLYFLSLLRTHPTGTTI